MMDGRVLREAKAMTRKEVIVKAIEGRLTWLQAADILGMTVHLDASTHAWLPGLPMQDLVVALDDADGRILYAAFWPQEGTASSFAALFHVLHHYGRFVELYTDRGSHFCRTATAGAGPELHQQGQVTRALRALGIRHILGRW